ncbi:MULTISPECIES: type II toxin-antitoxin system Phd/YefM family antitoxin [Bacteria]|uniref:type II toxin-antitoxin system Phd/YefM family antitoxin n=1 Tax=Bacteria TaxID=2 RepID=UPI003C7E86E9
MKTISVGELRQNPTRALDEVERGETYVVTRHRREIGRLVPPLRDPGASPDEFLSLLRATPLDGSWARELRDERGDFDGGGDAWSR